MKTGAMAGATGVLDRRRFVATLPAAALGATALSACSMAPDSEGYVAAAARLRLADSAPGVAGSVPGPALPRALPPAWVRELVRFATLAPSSHNTQCWTFAPQASGITIRPDLSRRCPAVDPDDHHLFVSLGCATENLVQAALAHGLQAEVGFDAASGAVPLVLSATSARSSPLFQAITARQCTRGDFDGQPLSAADLALLARAGTSGGVRLLLLTGRPALERVLDFVVQGNTAQLQDAAFVAELKSWVRFNGPDAVRTGDGLFSVCTGNPEIPAWLGRLAFSWFLTPRGENDRYARQIRNAAGIAVFVGAAADPAHWVAVGRCYERFALQATALGIRTAFLNQPVEVAALRPAFAAALGLAGQRPDLVVRFGRGPAMPQSLRRPVDSVMA